MLTNEELRDLADGIAARGQIHPIVLDRDGVLLDGRNRLAACKLAGIEPRFTTYNGDDPVGVILSYNFRRRHVSRGQQAIIVALARSLSERSLRADAATYGISITRLSVATSVVQHAPHLAEQVRIGAPGLDAAYDTVRKAKADNKARDASFQLLREHAPDLAEKVTLGETTLPEALAELDRQQAQEHLRQHVQNVDALRRADGLTEPPITSLADSGTITWQQAHDQADHYTATRKDKLHHAHQALEPLAQAWDVLHDLAHRPDSTYTRDVLTSLNNKARVLVELLITQLISASGKDEGPGAP
ncbi:ParB N-terminal domain-containing protein [Streptomyces sp. NBC_01476]|uniref:ParB N-terminal domain-containing protein n=1 Tax=Streptomyces sp. NBC_01476 TaxID=2903881 RepID=UPI002E2FE5F4|nr:ParB N-terminal domain-containing protein [Streptomyces sp. NBC_01476]